jgi:hypothetical protein
VTRALWPGRKRERGAGSRSHATRRPRAGTTSLQVPAGCACVRGSRGHAGMHARATHAAGDTSHAPSARVPRRRATSSGARARTATRGPHGATWRPRPPALAPRRAALRARPCDRAAARAEASRAPPPAGGEIQHFYAPTP